MVHSNKRWPAYLLDHNDHLAPELVYLTQNKFFPMPRETFNVVFYSFIRLFKIFFLFFNLVPWLALLIIG